VLGLLLPERLGYPGVVGVVRLVGRLPAHDEHRQLVVPLSLRLRVEVANVDPRSLKDDLVELHAARDNVVHQLLAAVGRMKVRREAVAVCARLRPADRVVHRVGTVAAVDLERPDLGPDGFEDVDAQVFEVDEHLGRRVVVKTLRLGGVRRQQLAQAKVGAELDVRTLTVPAAANAGLALAPTLRTVHRHQLLRAPFGVLTANPQGEPSVGALNGVEHLDHRLALVLPVQFQSGHALFKRIEPAVRVRPHRPESRQTHHHTQKYRPPLSKGVHGRVSVGRGHGVVTR